MKLPLWAYGLTSDDGGAGDARKKGIDFGRIDLVPFLARVVRTGWACREKPCLQPLIDDPPACRLAPRAVPANRGDAPPVFPPA